MSGSSKELSDAVFQKLSSFKFPTWIRRKCNWEQLHILSFVTTQRMLF